MTEQKTQTHAYQTLVSNYMDVEDVTWGDNQQDYWDSPEKAFIVRFRGRLKSNPTNIAGNLSRILRPNYLAVKEALTEAFRAENISPLVTREGEQDVIVLISDPLTSIVMQIMKISETQWAEPNQAHVIRFRGELIRDSMEAYDFIAEKLKPRDITPLFRTEDGQHAIILMRGINKPKPSNPWINAILFVLTVFTVLYVGVLGSGPIAENESFFDVMRGDLLGTVGFAAGILGILLAHEFGHYFAGRYHKTHVTLPYFIPFPSLFGTLGAFIQLKEAPKNKRVLLDIGIAGPLAGFIVAIPVLLYGLSISQVGDLPRFLLADSQPFSLEGNSIFYLLTKFAVFGEWLPAPDPKVFLTTSPIVYWAKFLLTGTPLPLGGRDVLIHPIAFAGWGGLLVTGLNLIPAGQLDGGHILYVLIGRGARKILPYVLIAMLGLAFFWSGWLLWAALIYFLGRVHAEPLDQITELDPRRKIIAWAGVILFILVFTPIPFQVIFGPIV